MQNCRQKKSRLTFTNFFVFFLLPFQPMVFGAVQKVWLLLKEKKDLKLSFIEVFTVRVEAFSVIKNPPSPCKLWDNFLILPLHKCVPSLAATFENFSPWSRRRKPLIFPGRLRCIAWCSMQSTKLFFFMLKSWRLLSYSHFCNNGINI